MLLQQSDLIIWETYYGYKGEFMTIARQTRGQPFVLDLSAVLDCVLDSRLAAHNSVAGPRPVYTLYFPVNKFLSHSKLCMIVTWLRVLFLLINRKYILD